MQKIGIIGQGFVGTAIREKFKNYFEIYTYDKAKFSWVYKDGKQFIESNYDTVVNNCEIIFVCLPTPMRETGECYTGIVEDVIFKIDESAKNTKTKIAVIKSTVPPGTTKRINKKCKNIQVVFNPEFLTEANANEDFANMKRVVLGGPRPATSKVKTIYNKVFPKATIVKTDSSYAEMVKYVTNTFLTTKVSYANEIYQLCEALDIDYDKVIEYATFDERLGQSHWAVPGPDGDFGFSGSCFPKDLNALMYIADKLGVEVNTLKAAWETNLKVRSNRDWEDMHGRAVIKE